MRHFGLIGNPVSQSLSEKYFTDKFELKNIEARFERFLLNDIHALPQLLAAYPQLEGLSVTSPFKTDIIRYCDDLNETAAIIRAVNTLKITRQGNKTHLTGYNTDSDGFAAGLIPILNDKKPNAIILGSGGAARAVAYTLNKLGIDFMVVSRHPGQGKNGYDSLNKNEVEKHKLIINATPLGMGRHIDELPPFPYHYLSPDHLLFDLIYNPPVTRFMEEGRKRKARTENGWIMLQAQAEKAWSIWNNE